MCQFFCEHPCMYLSFIVRKTNAILLSLYKVRHHSPNPTSSSSSSRSMPFLTFFTASQSQCSIFCHFDFLTFDVLTLRYFIFDIMSLRHFVFHIFNFDNLCSIYRARYPAFDIYVVCRYFVISIFCFRYRYLLRSLVVMRYFAFRYFVRNSDEHPPSVNLGSIAS